MVSGSSGVEKVPLVNARSLLAKVRRAVRPYGRLALVLHAVTGALAVGAWYIIAGPAWAGVIFLAAAVRFTPQLARERGTLFVL